ncbi:hypothetical protein LZC95_45575 [Pendulispora brunnea]|uniref:Uncharacterized protein n=1 Tax=Pendulispora brunnea TaxID=2905690 RepID=A0ABZ2K8M3_9BACT
MMRESLRLGRGMWVAGLTAFAATCMFMSPVGCSSSDSGESSTPDAGRDGSIIPPPPGPCDLSKDFGRPTLVPGLPTGSGKSSGARLSADELTVVYDDGKDLVLATRSDVASGFQTKPWLAATNSTAEDYLPWISTNGKDLYFMSNREVTTTYDLYHARRDDTGSAFGAAQKVFHLPSGNIASPYLLEGRELWLTRLDGDKQEIFRAPITGDATFGAATPVSELNDPASKNAGAAVTQDGLTVYFVSTRSGAGDQDIWVATRTTDSGTFGTPTRLPGVNSSFNDSPGWISPDGCRLYLSSDRDEGNDAGARETHTFVAQRPK